MDDAKIVQLFFDRDEQAIPETAKKYGNYCNAIARNILGSHEDAEGMWKLTFALPYPDATVEIPLHHLPVTDAGGSRYEVERMMLSPVGVHFDLILHEPDVDAFGGNFQVSIVLKDGTEIPLEGGGSGRWTEGDKKTEVTHYACFYTLINSEDIQAIIICDTVYEINIPGEE